MKRSGVLFVAEPLLNPFNEQIRAIDNPTIAHQVNKRRILIKRPNPPSLTAL